MSWEIGGKSDKVTFILREADAINGPLLHQIAGMFIFPLFFYSLHPPLSLPLTYISSPLYSHTSIFRLFLVPFGFFLLYIILINFPFSSLFCLYMSAHARIKSIDSARQKGQIEYAEGGSGGREWREVMESGSKKEEE